MPRKGKGSKTQAIQTAKDQTYGSAKQQEMAQEVAPLPQNVAGMGEPTALPPSRVMPGSAGDLFRTTDRPMEPSSAMPSQIREPKLTPERSQLLFQTMPLLQATANNPYANPDMQQTVLQMETFLPTRFDAS
tara:strand:- start:4125 stop:4520 length:396 start_codon:yes stop_codon:yes gene_type:complete